MLSRSVRAQARTSPRKPLRWFLGSCGRECEAFWKPKSDPKIELNFNVCIVFYTYSTDMSLTEETHVGRISVKNDTIVEV